MYKADVLVSNNSKYPVGSSIEVKHVYEKFYSNSFGKFFVVLEEDEYGVVREVVCSEKKSELLHGGSCKLVVDDSCLMVEEYKEAIVMVELDEESKLTAENLTGKKLEVLVKKDMRCIGC